MGIKLLKEKFGIEHIVHIDDGDICIGSPYCPRLITIKPDLEIEKSNLVSDGELMRVYKALIKANDEGMLAKCIGIDDVYKLPLQDIFTYDDGRVLKKQCEEYEYPNTTTDGELMYDNMFFKTRAYALLQARRNAKAFVGLRMNGFGLTVRECARQVKAFVFAIDHLIRAFIFRGY